MAPEFRFVLSTWDRQRTTQRSPTTTQKMQSHLSAAKSCIYIIIYFTDALLQQSQHLNIQVERYCGQTNKVLYTWHESFVNIKSHGLLINGKTTASSINFVSIR